MSKLVINADFPKSEISQLASLASLSILQYSILVSIDHARSTHPNKPKSTIVLSTNCIKPSAGLKAGWIDRKIHKILLLTRPTFSGTLLNPHYWIKERLRNPRRPRKKAI